MADWKIDPVKKDYVMEKGSPVQTTSLTAPAYIRLKAPRRKWMYAPDDNYGSDLKLVKRRHSTDGTSVVEDLAAKALQPIADDGRASEINIKTTVASRNATGLEIQILDAQGNPETLKLPQIGVS